MNGECFRHRNDAVSRRKFQRVLAGVGGGHIIKAGSVDSLSLKLLIKFSVSVINHRSVRPAGPASKIRMVSIQTFNFQVLGISTNLPQT